VHTSGASIYAQSVLFSQILSHSVHTLKFSNLHIPDSVSIASLIHQLSRHSKQNFCTGRHGLTVDGRGGREAGARCCTGCGCTTRLWRWLPSMRREQTPAMNSGSTCRNQYS